MDSFYGGRNGAPFVIKTTYDCIKFDVEQESNSSNYGNYALKEIASFYSNSVRYLLFEENEFVEYSSITIDNKRDLFQPYVVLFNGKDTYPICSYSNNQVQINWNNNQPIKKTVGVWYNNFAGAYLAIEYKNNKYYYVLDNGNFIYRDNHNKDQYDWKYTYLNNTKVETEDGKITLPSVELISMYSVFSKGASTTDKVNFGEYVMIDTWKNNHMRDAEDNGKIFRRGYNFNDDIEFGGAEYIGKVLGPKGSNPEIELTSFEELKNKYGTEFESNILDFNIVLPKEENGHFQYANPGDQNSPSKDGTYYTDTDIANTTSSIKPGKFGDDYNDKIKYGWYSLKDGEGNVEKCLIGFEFPYLVTEFESVNVGAYYNRNSNEANFTNDNLVTRIDNHEHPYYQKWQIAIPKGIKGDSSNEFRIISATNDDKIEPYTGQNIDREEKTTEFEKNEGTRKILVYDYYHYDTDSTGDKKSYYIGDYNMIYDIIVHPEGTVRVGLTHEDDIVLPQRINWIDKTEFEDNGTFRITYNNNNLKDIHDNQAGKIQTWDKQVNWINSIGFSNDGTVTITDNNDNIAAAATGEKYEHPEDKIAKWPKLIKWITNIGLDEDGLVHWTDNQSRADSTYNLNPNEKRINWIKDISFNENGTVSIEFNNDNIGIDGGKDEEGNKINSSTSTWSNLIKWVDDVEFSHDGLITWYDNRFKNEDGSYDSESIHKLNEDTARINWIEDVSFNKNGTVTIKYNNNNLLKSTEDGKISKDDKSLTTSWNNLINWIDNTEFEDDGTFRITYNNNNIGIDENGATSTWDKQVNWLKSIGFTNDGTVTITDNNDNIAAAATGEKVNHTINKTASWPNLINWIEELSIAQNGLVTLKDNNGNITGNSTTKTKTWTLNWINKISVDEEDGTIKYYYCSDKNNAVASLTQSKLIKWIKDIAVDDDGTLTVKYNNNSEDSIFDKKIEWIDNVNMSTDGAITITYNTGASETLSNKVKWFNSIDLNTNTGELSYTDNQSDTAHKLGTLNWIKEASFNEEDNKLKFSFINESIEDIEIAIPIEEIVSARKDEENNKEYESLAKRLNEMQKQIIELQAIIKGEESPDENTESTDEEQS